mmetsp:Transcript_11469/g.13110  ORF Transcript_11469/g.13110 Transcript_11469/m.13110 type:complete len:135 (+) Transcript_11469:472-876(+)
MRYSIHVVEVILVLVVFVISVCSSSSSFNLNSNNNENENFASSSTFTDKDRDNSDCIAVDVDRSTKLWLVISIPTVPRVRAREHIDYLTPTLDALASNLPKITMIGHCLILFLGEKMAVLTTDPVTKCDNKHEM